jgi:hypothetical protein
MNFKFKQFRNKQNKKLNKKSKLIFYFKQISKLKKSKIENVKIILIPRKEKNSEENRKIK